MLAAKIDLWCVILHENRPAGHIYLIIWNIETLSSQYSFISHAFNHHLSLPDINDPGFKNRIFLFLFLYGTIIVNKEFLFQIILLSKIIITLFES
jgi:hypothetical protein